MQEQLQQWLREAKQNESCRYPMAACLSTVATDGMPDGRTIIVDRVEDTHFYFCTDRRSKKARDLTSGLAALTFNWDTGERQLRVRGTIALGDRSVAESNFLQRPRQSQVTAHATTQSAPAESEEAITRRYHDQEQLLAQTQVIACPDTWVAYCLSATQIEFWEARSARLHHRVLHTMAHDGSWSSCLLQP